MRLEELGTSAVMGVGKDVTGEGPLCEQALRLD